MMNRSRWALGALAGVVQIATPAAASSQTSSPPAPAEAAVYTACYIPLVGAVYRIKELGLPTACLSTKHVEFSWNQIGAKGDKGDTGATGAPGQAGAALTPMACPPGFFVGAFGSVGEPICMDADGNERLTIPSPPWTATWQLAPVLRVVCGDAGSALELQITTARTRLVSGGLSLRLMGTLDGMSASLAPLMIPDPIVPPFIAHVVNHIVQVEGQPPNAANQPFVISLTATFKTRTSLTFKGITTQGRLVIGENGGDCIRKLLPGQQEEITGTNPS